MQGRASGEGSPVRFEGLDKRVQVGGADSVILNDVSGFARAGSFVMLSGVSGSGKTTLLNILGAVDRPTSGVVTVGDTEVSALDSRQCTKYRAITVGFIFQFFNLLPTLSALENVSAGLEPVGIKRRQRQERSLRTLSSVGMEGHASKFPFQMSGGEQQRVGIARAIAKTPKLILADEPTGALDDANAVMVMDLLEKVRQETGVTIIVASHDPLVREYCDVEWVLRDHRLEEAV